MDTRTLRRLNERVEWLEQQMLIHTGVQCTSIPTGTALQPLGERPVGIDRASQGNIRDENHATHLTPQTTAAVETLQADDSFSAAISAPEISILAFNAIGETRYLGPSSGVPFAGHAAAMARHFTNRSSPLGPIDSPSNNGPPLASITLLTDHDVVQDVEEVEALVHLFRTWTQPLYPLLEVETLHASMMNCRELETVVRNDGHSLTFAQSLQMAKYYLVLALGAMHDGSATDGTAQTGQSRESQRRSYPRRDPARLYLKSKEYFDIGNGNTESSIPLIQVVLLMCVYGSHGKVGFSQWQLAGFAMRVSHAHGESCSGTDNLRWQSKLVCTNRQALYK